MRRITKAALGGLVGGAVVFGATQFAAGASDLATYEFARRLIDVQTNPDPGPFDSARARLQISETADGSTFTLSIRGIDPSAAGQSFGAHLHTNSCVKGDIGGLLAGPHYKHDVTKAASPENEVWFDLSPNEDGTASYQTSELSFKVPPGDAQSVVIHARPTNTVPDEFVQGPIGSAGARWACLPVDYEDLQ